MAVQVKAIDTLKQAMHGCIALENAKGELSKLFHRAMIEALNENPGMTGEELGKFFSETMAEVENTLRSEIVEARGDFEHIREVVPSWVQYHSDIKRAFELVDRRDLVKCRTFSDVKKKLQEVRDALKEKAAGESGGDPADNGAGDGAGSKAGGSTIPGFDSLPESVRTELGAGLKALAQLSEMSEGEAAKVAQAFHNKANAALRTFGNAHKKVAAGVNSGANH